MQLEESNSQVITIVYIDPENDVALRNMSSGQYIATNLDIPAYDIKNVTVTTNVENYTLSLYIKGAFNLTGEDFTYTYKSWLYWNWSDAPGSTTASQAYLYEDSNTPQFSISDNYLGDKEFDQGARFDIPNHRFTCSFNRSWIADSVLGLPINEFWINAQIASYIGYIGGYPMEYRDNLTNGYYQTNSIGLQPQADFSADKTSVSILETIQFTYTGTAGDGIDSYQWNFGDNPSNATTANPTHQYATVGVFTVILTMNDTDGDESTCIKINYINVSSTQSDLPPTMDFLYWLIPAVVGVIIVIGVMTTSKKRLKRKTSGN